MALTKITGEGIQGISNSANATAITISSDEEVTMPLQPAFLAGPSADQSNFLSFCVRMQQVDDGSSYVYIQIITSNRNYIYIFAPNVFDQDADYWTATQSGIFDMDANDSAAITFNYVNGSQQVDIRDFTNGTYFSGALIC